jgi:hypothetical protein
MKARVRFGSEALKAAHQEFADNLELVDQSLRKSFSGLEVDAVVPELVLE